MQLAEEEEVGFDLTFFVSMIVPHLINLLHDQRFQDLAMDAGVSVAQMILDHLSLAFGVDNNNSDSVNDFYGRMEAAYPRRKGKGKKMKMEFAIAEEEENSEPLSVALHIILTLAMNPLVQKLALEAGIGIFKFILEHAKAAHASNGNAKKFRSAVLKRRHESIESDLAELEERLAFAPAYGEEFEDLLAGIDEQNARQTARQNARKYARRQVRKKLRQTLRQNGLHSLCLALKIDKDDCHF